MLELGVGSGRVAELLLDRLAEAALTGVDASRAMLGLAAKRLDRFGPRAALVEADLRAPELLAVDPPDLVVSVQALHHLEPAEQRRLWLRVGELTPPDALVLLRDKVAVPAALHDAFAVVWAEHGYALPPTAAALAAELAAKGDHPAPLADQLAWLDEAGFEAAVLDVRAHYALVAARRRPAA